MRFPSGFSRLRRHVRLLWFFVAFEGLWILARSLVDTAGLVVVAGSLYVVGAARADILASAVPWEDAGR